MSTPNATNKCVSCGVPIQQPRTGRPRRYCSIRCKKSDYRQRRTNSKWVKAVEGELHVISDPPSKQIANAIAEAAVIAAAFRRLAIEEPSPILGAGCEHAYLEILTALDRNFPGWSA